VGEMLADQPEANARVRYTLARVFHDLGNGQRAQRELEAARECLRLAGLSDDAQDLELKMRIGEAMLATGDYPGAERTAAEVHIVAERTLGPQHRTTLGAKNVIARCYVMRKDWGKAVPMLKDLWEATTQAFGPRDSDSLATLSGYANALVEM